MQNDNIVSSPSPTFKNFPFLFPPSHPSSSIWNLGYVAILPVMQQLGVAA